MRTLFIALFLSINTFSFGQKKTITGQVFDKETLTSLKGANIIILGSTNGTITNDSGYFEFPNKYENSVARISYVGYKFYDIKLSPELFISVELDKELTLLPTMNIGLGEYSGPSKYLESELSGGDIDMEEETIDQVYLIVEESAGFYGGLDNLYAFFSANFKYPKNILDDNLGGKVSIEFTILDDGSISNVIFVNRGIPNEVKEEVKRIFGLMPKWTPATQRGQNIDQKFIATILYAANK